MKHFSHIFFLFLLFASCNAEKSAEPKKGNPATLPVETTESLPVNGDYVYEITDLNSGEKKVISQQEYLKSEYIDNPDYSVEEKFKVK